MRLKSIKLSGFKSFVDPTVIPMRGNLIGVVGPNGCGKSNVIDAARWVMGESTAKYLRGESITDVIFNGSTARKPVSQASVELLFDNEEGALGGEYASYAEISIRRIVTRDAQSTYYLNGTRCRRKDITDIFLGTGLGPRSYSIIEQGTISRLIEAKPEELRIYLEEAAGISKYKERRRETELRIQHTKENLTRLSDIVEELDKQLNHLQRQAAAAERFKILKQEERLLKVQLQALRWQELNEQIQNKSRLMKELEVQLEAQIAEQRALEAQLEMVRAAQIESNDIFSDIQRQFYELGVEISRLEQTIQYNRERKQQLENELMQAEQLRQESIIHLEEDIQKMEALTIEKTLILPDVDLAKAAEEDALEGLMEAEQNVRDWQREWDEFNHQAANTTQRAQVEQTRIQHSEKHIQSVQERINRLSQEQLNLTTNQSEDEIIILQGKIEDLVLQQEILEEQLTQILMQINQGRDLTQQLSQQLNVQRSQLQTFQGRYASLEALQQSALGQRKSDILHWLQHYQLNDMPRLAQVLNVEEGWEKAVETVLGNDLEAICIPPLTNLEEIILSFQQDTLTLFDSSIEENVALTKQPGLLLEKIQTTLPLVNLLSGIHIAETLNEGITLAKSLTHAESVVTKNGVWLGKGWVRVSNETEPHHGILLRERELEENQASITTIQKQIEALESNTDLEYAKLKELEIQREEKQHQLSDLKSIQANMRAQLHVKQSRIEQVQHRLQQIEHEIEECQRLLHQNQHELISARQLWQEAMQLMDQQTDQRNELLNKREKYTQALQQIRQQAQAHREKAHHLTLRLQTVTTQLQSIQDNHLRLQKQAEKIEERRKELQTLITEMNAPSSDIAQELDTQLFARSKVETELMVVRQKVESYEQDMRQIAQQRQIVDQKLLGIRQELEQKRLDLQTRQVKSETLLEQINEVQFNLNTVIQEMPHEAKETEWQEKLELTINKISRLGAVNLAAIEEYQLQAERKNYLDAQNNDLMQALNTLEEAIRKIDRETRAKFKETFDLVNQGFQTLFPRVFGGGRAYLALTGEDLLNTGITVMAQPPGKRNSTIHLLSGGEKAMTAVALVFAIFQLNPAPFCMLDEVDAPLDDANVSRFCGLVKEMSEKVQFIFITHNKVTMELAEYLTGVTMNEPGVSRLVAVDVESALAMADG